MVTSERPPEAAEMAVSPRKDQSNASVFTPPRKVMIGPQLRPTWPTSELRPTETATESAVPPIGLQSNNAIFAPPAKVNNVGPKKGPTKLPPSVQREKNRIDSLARSPPSTEKPPSWISKIVGTLGSNKQVGELGSNKQVGELGSNKEVEKQEANKQFEKQAAKPKPKKADSSWVYSICFQLDLPSQEKNRALTTNIEPDFEMVAEDIDDVASREPSINDEKSTTFQSETSMVPVVSSSGWFLFSNLWITNEEIDDEENVDPVSIRTLRFSPLSIDKSGSFFWEWNDGGIIDEHSCKIARFLGLDDEFDDDDEDEYEEYVDTRIKYAAE